MTNASLQFDSRSADPDDPVYLSTYSVQSMHHIMRGGRQAAPLSGGIATAGQCIFVPFYINKPYSLQRYFMARGATLGAAFYQQGVYNENLSAVHIGPLAWSGVGTINTVSYTNLTTSVHSLSGGTSTLDQDIYFSAAVQFRAGRMYTAVVENTGTNAALPVLTNGMTWTQRATVQFSGTGHRVTLFTGVPTADVNTAVKIDFGASSGTTGVLIYIHGWFGVDTTTNDGIVQTVTNTGTASTAPTCTLGAFGNADNGTFAAIGNTSTATFANKAGFQTVGSITVATPNQRVSAEHNTGNDTTPGGTLSVAVDWGIIGAEVKSLGATTPVVLPPMRGYLAMFSASAVPTFMRAPFITTVPGIYVQNSQSWLQAEITPSVGGIGPNIPVMGITRRLSP